MCDGMDQGLLLHELQVKVAALEGTLSFLEMWCEEQQDALDLVGLPGWPPDDLPAPRLYAIDLRDGDPGEGDDDERPGPMAENRPVALPGGQEVVELHQHPSGPGVEPAV